MEIGNRALVIDLQTKTQEVLAYASYLKSIELEILNYKTTPDSWSALECLEHLNLYSEFYLPKIGAKILTAEKIDDQQIFKSGWLGDYFVKTLAPKEKLNKMKTLSAMNPTGSDLSIDCIDRFIADQTQLLSYLKQSINRDLRSVKISVSFSSILRVRLGDVYRFLVCHNQRHILQVKNALRMASKSLTTD